MKKVIFGNLLKKTEIFIEDVTENAHIFSKENGVINGYLNQNMDECYEWIHRIGSFQGAYGYFKTRIECMKKSHEYGYEFFIDQGGVHKKIILKKPTDIIHYDVVAKNSPIFVKREREFIGMVIHDLPESGFTGWLIKTGGPFGTLGHFGSLLDLIQTGKRHGFEFFVE